jgi:hypothetical protein
MKRSVFVFVLSVLVPALSKPAWAEETFDQYVSTCMTQLGFQSSDLRDVNCNNGMLFDSGDSADLQTNDVVLNQRVNDQVDATVACRWLVDDNGDRVLPPGSNGTHVSGVEMLIHNRFNGATCFFTAQDGSSDFPGNVSPQVVSPTNGMAPVPPSQYWEAPSYVNNNARCVNCHSAGPYIASSEIASLLGRYGLLNNGHDVFARTSAATNYYHAVGDTFSQAWNQVIQTKNVNIPNGCGNCHVRSTSDELTPSVLARHITNDNGGVFNRKSILTLLTTQPRIMPQDSGERLSDDYRWMNATVPNQGSGGDRETYDKLWYLAPGMVTDCILPKVMEARVVGAEQSLRTDAFPNFLDVFNPVDGLSCKNNDNTNTNGCSDYEVQSRCAPLAWPSIWQNADHPNSGNGDGEPTPNPVMPPPGQSCKLELRARVVGTSDRIAYALPDRLHEFTTNGFICLNAEQNDGQCENYTVRYICPDVEQPSGQIVRIHSQAYPSSYLTTTRPLNASGQEDPNGVRYAKGQPNHPEWASQSWVLEPVWPTQYWRIRNVWNRTYLNVSTLQEAQAVTSEDLNQKWWAEEWSIEWAGSFWPTFRLRNRWTGKYLTLHDGGDFSAVYSQDSQTWITQWWSLGG